MQVIMLILGVTNSTLQASYLTKRKLSIINLCAAVGKPDMLNRSCKLTLMYLSVLKFLTSVLNQTADFYLLLNQRSYSNNNLT